MEITGYSLSERLGYARFLVSACFFTLQEVVRGGKGSEVRAFLTGEEEEDIQDPVLAEAKRGARLVKRIAREASLPVLDEVTMMDAYLWLRGRGLVKVDYNPEMWIQVDISKFIIYRVLSSFLGISEEEVEERIKSAVFKILKAKTS